MNVTTKSLVTFLSSLRQYFLRVDFVREDVKDKPPLRGELFSQEELDQHAKYLAQSHLISEEHTSEQLLKRLSENEEVITRVVKLLQESLQDKKSISPAGEWLLDNFYLIEDQIRMGKRHLPKGYSRGLPQLKNGKSADLPRVYDLVIEIIAHSDGHVDIESLSGFIASYQKVQYLTIGELWAIPIMLRLALLENLGRVASHIAIDSIDTDLAGYWAGKIIETAEENPRDIILTLSDMARSKPPMVSSFVAEFARRIQWKGMDLSLVLTWIDQQLTDQGETAQSMINAENQKQAANQLSVSNSINSLRFLAKMDWREFIEKMSVVENTLRKDPAGVYHKMDFYSRDRYRHTVEKISKHSTFSEYEVSQAVIDLAERYAVANSTRERKSHVGYYLIDKGAKQIKSLANFKLTPRQRLSENLRQNAGILYTLLILAFTAATSYGIIYYASLSLPLIQNIIFGLVAMLFSSQVVMSMVNWLSSLFMKPEMLPKMDFSEGIPNEFRTMVVVPCLITHQQQAEKLIDDLEVRLLANRDPNLLFGLATDFKDAPEKMMPGDTELINFVSASIVALNRKYNRQLNDTIFLFHRQRKWNETEKVWMGYERKRGKLSDLNLLLRGNGDGLFAEIVGEEKIYRSVKYIITLDADTQLPREGGWKLTGLMAHPLNSPVYDEHQRRVIKGYSIIQPRIAISLHGATRSLYSRLHENDTGIDPYTRVTSDVYQDVFGEGSYIGKGIYDVDTFQKVLHQRFPENRILSHDLLEGLYARCGYASDIQLYEENPSQYTVDAQRRHRWIRGDWQIVRWLWPVVPDQHKKSYRNTLTFLSRWKIADNIRRSLIPLATLVLLISTWLLLPQPHIWTLVLLALYFIPTVSQSVWSFLKKPNEIGWRQHGRIVFQNTSKAFMQGILMLVMLPYEMYYNTHAILQTLWRMSISGKKLLEWNPSGFTALGNNFLSAAYKSMWFSPFTGIVLILVYIRFRPEALFISIPFICLWIAAPFIAWVISRPLVLDETRLTGDQKLYLREVARRTWSFFEDLITEKDNWLPPDNIQQYPIAVVAQRTSPTNMGMSLLANLTAYDFGYLSTTQLIDRCRLSLGAMEKLERYKGHFYNWYDTRSLRTLFPRYISTVDSGNLAGHLITLRQGLMELPAQKIIQEACWNGLHDTVSILKQHLDGDPSPIEAFEQEFGEYAEKHPSDLFQLKDVFVKLLQLLPPDDTKEFSEEATYWLQSLRNQLLSLSAEILRFAPWLASTEVPEKFHDYLHIEMFGLAEFQDFFRTWHTKVNDDLQKENTDKEQAWLKNTHLQLQQSFTHAQERLQDISRLVEKCDAFADMAYDFLYDGSKHLLSIGYSVDQHHLDNSYYDLLASEARLGIFVAIAQNKIPQESWFALGRRLTDVGGTSTLISWSGSMFEYLMPNLVMPSYRNTLLDETVKGCIKEQIAYGDQQGVPWGISESCYNMVDAQLIYQYRAFGVPRLGFKRGLSQDLVIAPYASVMALMIDPAAAYHNLLKLKKVGAQGRYGFFESIDYTALRLPRGKNLVMIQTFMVHHQGMSLLSLSHVLLEQPMQKRFAANQQFQSALLLLQERVPKTTGFYKGSSESVDVKLESVAEPQIRIYTTPDTAIPEVQLMSNGRYHVMVSNAGGGYSRWKNIAVTRWREDTTRDNWGTFCYIRNKDTKEFWSNTHQPTLQIPDSYSAMFSLGRAEFMRVDQNIETHTEIIVSPEDDVEIRRIQFTNNSRDKVTLSITSYGEAVLAPLAADVSHPAFSNLFVQTEIATAQQAIFCTRRARSAGEFPPFMFHLMKLNGIEAEAVSYETDRNVFIGRGNSVVNPQAIQQDSLSNSQGSVLDPIVAIQYTVTFSPGEQFRCDLVTGMAPHREGAQHLVNKYQDRHLRDRIFELSFTHSQVMMRQINANESDAQVFNRLASSVIFNNCQLRSPAAVLTKNHKGQSALWSYSISGDLPIVLVQIADIANLSMVKQLVQARAYWQMKGLVTDLIILNEDPSGYRQVLQDQIQTLIAAGFGINPEERKGGIYIRSSDQISVEDKILLQTVARVMLSDQRGTLLEQVNKTLKARTVIPFEPSLNTFLHLPPEEVNLPTDLQLFNGTGGFSANGKEYYIITKPGRITPMPWINVIANPHFGTIVTESSPGYTWCDNAHEYRLTPWYNDPISGVSGEAFYLRDDESGRIWSPTPYPSPNDSAYITRHGFGYTIFEHLYSGIQSELCIYVDRSASLKFSVLKIKNRSGRKRKISAYAYVEWVLAATRAQSGLHIVTESVPADSALFARNAYHSDFSHHVSFLAIDEIKYSFTTDRAEFIGRNGTLKDPKALYQQSLSGRSGAGIDSCGAYQLPLVLNEDEEYEVIFRMGTGKSMAHALELVKNSRGSAHAQRALAEIRRYWMDTLGTIQINTPNQALNILSNGWLIYQVLSCRLWGRSGFYQSGGAFGFRDQLQDVLALLHINPRLTRSQIMRAAGRQFEEGDVQHWWHPPSGKGVRTMCSDDFLWLPYVTSRYVTLTGDVSVLDEQIPFLEGRRLNAGEESYYDLPIQGEEKGSLYEHSKRAIQHALVFGEHGLSLIGSGDWNDGMNMVGIEGRGESVWLSFFLYDVLNSFSKVALLNDDKAFSEECSLQANRLEKNINQHAWDGAWYLRAFFDDGTPMGSSENTECRIDSISQSWSILSGAGFHNRSVAAMDAVNEKLVNRESGLLQLLDPPFDKALPDPGYIKGYVPGVRENGGQYTHAAIWMVMAFAKLGEVDRVHELLNLINPLQHGMTELDVSVYKVEPYVMAADVYGVPPHTGRGGWTWYTGSAGWMYQLILEWVLGLHREGDELWLTPCVPWTNFSIKYIYESTSYHIEFVNLSDEGEDAIFLDGGEVTGNRVKLIDDQKDHTIQFKFYKINSATAIGPQNHGLHP